MDKLQEYLEMRERHQRDVNNFPIAFAFNEKQLNEALEKLSVKSIDECCTVHNCGDIIRKRDFKAYKDMSMNHVKELNEAMKDPEFAKSAFRYEMDNHEYAINWDGDSDVLNCFGWTPESFTKVDISIQNAYLFARNEHIEHFRNLGVI
ncbi:DUF7659 family protein [Eubacterium ramulus]|uniref:DUF7659 family protein n=1 Tax=Eubacterium ramulus TaxID=39490 RepID=UPI0022E2C776|nr:hypothetical protein [Eubacterium ramulus]